MMASNSNYTKKISKKSKNRKRRTRIRIKNWIKKSKKRKQNLIAKKIINLIRKC